MWSVAYDGAAVFLRFVPFRVFSLVVDISMSFRTSVISFITEGPRGRFKSRSIERDLETDSGRISAIMAVIDKALDEAQGEKAGLNQRVDEALARAAVTLGNAADEYLEREPLDNYHQDLFSSEISNGERRSAELVALIEYLGSIKSEISTRYPHLLSSH